MFLTLTRFAKSKHVLVLLRSAAGTGQVRLQVRERLADKVVKRMWDKVVKKEVLFMEEKKIRSIK